MLATTTPTVIVASAGGDIGLIQVNIQHAGITESESASEVKCARAAEVCSSVAVYPWRKVRHAISGSGAGGKADYHTGA